MLDKGQREDWFAVDFIVTFALIAASRLSLFFPWELSRKDPIVDLRLLLHRQFAIAFL